MYHFSIAVDRVPLVTLFCGLHNAFILRHRTFLTSASKTRSCKASNGYSTREQLRGCALKKKEKGMHHQDLPAIISRVYSACTQRVYSVSVARSQYDRLTISTHGLFQQQQNRKTPHLASTVFKADYSPNFSLSPI